MKNVLIYSHYFWPSIGGVEHFTELLANGLVSDYNISIMTKTSLSNGEHEINWGFPIHRIDNLSFSKKLNVDIIIISGFSVKMIVYAWFWRIPIIVIHHGDLLNCSNGTGLHNGHLCYHNKMNCFKYDFKYQGWNHAIKNQINLFCKRLISFLPKKHIFVSQWLRTVTGLNGEVIYNCYDNKFLVDMNRDKSSQIIFAGRLVDIKGCDKLIKAYAKANVSMPLIICGNGPEKEKLEKLVYELRVDHKVIFKGTLSKNALANEMHKSTVCVIPSIVEESFGLTAIEAAAANCIVIGRRLGGLAEVCEKVGYSFMNDDELIQLLRDAESGTLKEKSSNLDLFSCKRMVEAYSKKLDEHLRRKK